MTAPTLNQTDLQNPSHNDLEKLNNILAERLTFDPFSVDDETLWRIVSERENAKLHNYHCMIVRFGEPYEVPATSNYPSYKRIPISYTTKSGSRNLKDYAFPIDIGDGKKRYNVIYDPHSIYRNHWVMNYNNPEIDLANQDFFLLRSLKGKNRYGKEKFIWIMVKLDDDNISNCKIVREYTLKAQIWAYNAILSNPMDFGLNLTTTQIDAFIQPLITKNKQTLNDRLSEFVQRYDEKDEDEDEYYDNGYDRAYEQDLKDELNYIRQNGGDWIDD